MNAKPLSYLLTFVFLLMTASASFAAGDQKSGANPMSTMANIMLNLNHYPSDSEKQKLKNIVSSSESADIKAIATAILNLEHEATSSDKSRMKVIMNNSGTDAKVRDMASIVYNLSHKPSSGDKSKLMTMMD